MTSRRDGTGPAYRIRPATLADTDFLADVVVTATRAQGRLPGDFGEPAWRSGFARWTGKQIRERQPSGAAALRAPGLRQIAEDEQEHKLRWSPQENASGPVPRVLGTGSPRPPDCRRACALDWTSRYRERCLSSPR